MAEPRMVCIDPVRGVYDARWDQPPALPGYCWTPWHGYHNGDAFELPGCDDGCPCNHCAAHRWTHCGSCGRAGDRPGDECTIPCVPYTPETP